MVQWRNSVCWRLEVPRVSEHKRESLRSNRERGDVVGRSRKRVVNSRPPTDLAARLIIFEPRFGAQRKARVILACLGIVIICNHHRRGTCGANGKWVRFSEVSEVDIEDR